MMKVCETSEAENVTVKFFHLNLKVSFNKNFKLQCL